MVIEDRSCGAQVDAERTALRRKERELEAAVDDRDQKLGLLRRLLTRNRIFYGIDDRVMDDICQRLRYKEMKPRHVLFAQGDPPMEFFILLKGVGSCVRVRMDVS